MQSHGHTENDVTWYKFNHSPELFLNQVKGKQIAWNSIPILNSFAFENYVYKFFRVDLFNQYFCIFFNILIYLARMAVLILRSSLMNGEGFVALLPSA